MKKNQVSIALYDRNLFIFLEITPNPSFSLNYANFWDKEEGQIRREAQVTTGPVA